LEHIFPISHKSLSVCGGLTQCVSLAFRNPMHRIVPAVALAGSSIPAFDDINTSDPDFEYIQGKNR